MNWCRLPPEECPFFVLKIPNAGFEFYQPTPEGREALDEDILKYGTIFELEDC